MKENESPLIEVCVANYKGEKTWTPVAYAICDALNPEYPHVPSREIQDTAAMLARMLDVQVFLTHDLTPVSYVLCIPVEDVRWTPRTDTERRDADTHHEAATQLFEEISARIADFTGPITAGGAMPKSLRLEPDTHMVLFNAGEDVQFEIEVICGDLEVDARAGKLHGWATLTAGNVIKWQAHTVEVKSAAGATFQITHTLP